MGTSARKCAKMNQVRTCFGALRGTVSERLQLECAVVLGTTLKRTPSTDKSATFGRTLHQTAVVIGSQVDD